MAEEPAAQPELSESNADKINPSGTEDMDLESTSNLEAGVNGDANEKRAREEEGNDGVSKKQKVGEEGAKDAERSVEEERLDKILEEGENGSDRVNIGPREFGSSVEMFDYFYKLLHFWPPNLNINKYEQMVLLDLIKKGHSEPDKKIGKGIQAFQVRHHPMFKSRCFFVIREDKSVDDFSFRKCVDQILPLPENMKINSHDNKTKDSGRGKGRGGKFRGGKGGHGRGRGGKSRK